MLNLKTIVMIFVSVEMVIGLAILQPNIYAFRILEIAQAIKSELLILVMILINAIFALILKYAKMLMDQYIVLIK